jgi:glycosyltransferase involved in cell wall biosynthesis
MRVGLFTESYDPVINGVSTSVKTLAAELARAGHEAVIVAPRFPGYADEPTESSQIEVRRLPSWRTPLNPRNPFAFPPVGLPPSAYRDRRYNIVHTQQPFGIGLHGRIAARRSSCPLVSTFHTLYHEYTHYAPMFPKPLARRWLRGQLTRYYACCDAVVVPSKAAGRVLEQVMGVPGDRLHVIPTGIPEPPSVMPAAVEQTRKAFSLPKRAPVLLFVGRVAPEKNLDLLVEAFGRLSDGHPASSPETHPILLIAGDGPYLNGLKERVRRAELDAYVRFAGFLKRNQLAPVYAAATLFVFPSVTETQGVVLSEAQSHGLPCVLCDGGGAPEFVRQDVDALVVPSGDAAAFAAAVRSLLTDDAQRRAFSAAALKSPLRPTPPAMARRMIALYESLVSGTAASPALRPDARADDLG